MNTRNYLSIDLGAESGRALVGVFDGERLSIDEVYRFPNGPVRAGKHMYWDVLRMYSEIGNGLRAAFRKYGEIESMAVDTWGVDFGLFDKNGELLGNPYHYRDSRTEGVMERVFSVVPAADVFEATGIQFMRINTLYQLASMAFDRSQALESADSLLMMPDIFTYWLTGEKASEYTIATTSQCYDPKKKDWAYPITEKLGIPSRIFRRVIEPATLVGRLSADAEEHVGACGVKVTAPASHDTASAVAAIASCGDDCAYISSGTWSLLGTLTESPVMDRAALDYGFTNEGGVDGTIRLLKNITGLWLIRECKRVWAESGNDTDYKTLTGLAERAGRFRSFIDTDHESFSNPVDMTAAIRDYCTGTGQEQPTDRGSIARAVFESLAFKYRLTIEKLEKITGRKFAAIRIVGGGSLNELLSGFAANACGRTVHAGPVEATALGNILAQTIACGTCSSWSQARELVKDSFPPRTYEPRDVGIWNDAYARYIETIARG